MARNLTDESRPEGGGVETFDTTAAQTINTARLDHLASLQLDLGQKTVLDAGAGPGHLGQFFVDRHCHVLSVDGRADNIARLRALYPDRDAAVADVERDSLTGLGRFDIVLCYGLLYHLEDPVAALRNLAEVCDGILLLETVICDSSRAILRLEDEYLSFSQALYGIAHRPSPRWIALTLDRIGFANVYAARTPPRHEDFEFDWLDDLDTTRDGHLLRMVFVATREPVANEHLIRIVTPK